jgi:Tol biopolymer transport system component
LVSGPAGPNDKTGIWVLRLAGGTLSKLQDDAWGAVPSPDSSWIAFRRASAPELWLMDGSGGRPRRLLTAVPEHGFGERMAWSPDGRRLAFQTTNRTGTVSTIQTYDLKTGRATIIVSDSRIEQFCWARDGRILYARAEDPPHLRSSNLWELSLHPQTAQVRGPPRRLTNWNDFTFGYLDISAAGKRLSFVRSRVAGNVYVGSLASGGARLAAPKRLTFDQWMDWPTGWTHDNKSILFHSNRSGVLDVFRQAVDASQPRPIVSGTEERTDARVSPDGHWILYFAWPRTGQGNRSGQARLMRVPSRGGSPQLVLQAAGHIGPAPDEAIGRRPISFAEGDPRFRCPSEVGRPCVLSERFPGRMVFTAFDPLDGRRGEVARIEIDRSRHVFWDLSQDGRWIAFGICDDIRTVIRLVPLANQPERAFTVPGSTNLTSIAWAANGQGLFATGWASRGSPLLRISLDGKAQLLYKSRLYLESPLPSRDGRFLAFGEEFLEANAWVLENR